MKRFLLLFAMLALLVAFPLSASADVDTLLNLAEIYPDSAVVFGAFRVDDATIDAIDDLLMSLAERVRGGFSPEDVSLRSALDDVAADFQEGATYESLIGSWLGDTAAVGLFLDEEFVAAMEAESIDGPEDLPVVWSLEITDADAAAEFVAAVILDEGSIADIQDLDGYTLFDFQSTEYAIAVAEDVLVGGSPDYVIQVIEGDFEATLVDDETFNNTLELLNEDDYAALAYVNQTAVLEAIGEANVEEFDLSSLSMGMGGQVVGLTMLDGRTLTVDVVQQVQDLGEMGFVVGGFGAVDPAFVQRIPQSTPLLLHSTNLKGVYDAFLANTKAIEELSAEGEAAEVAIDEFAAQLMEETGLDLEADIISWMTGDYAIFLDIRKEVEDATSIFSLLTALPLEFGVVIDDSANPAAAAKIIDVIETVLQKQAVQLAEDEFATTELALAREDIAQTNALVMTITDSSGSIPFPVELILASNDDVMALGTRTSVTAMLLNDGGLSADATYRDATSVFVADPTAVAYIGFPSLLRLVNVISAASDEQTGTLVEDILSLFSHWTISSGEDADGNFRSRLTITIAPAE